MRPVEDRLSQFTPSAGDLDRDALLFAAGRASARPHRVWVTLAAVLAASQLATLVVLWPRPGLVENAPVVVPVPGVEAEVPLPETSPVPGLPLIRRDFASDVEKPYLEPPSGDLVPDEPPLHALSAGQASLLY